jgi:hypothetical protein
MPAIASLQTWRGTFFGLQVTLSSVWFHSFNRLCSCLSMRSYSHTSRSPSAPPPPPPSSQHSQPYFNSHAHSRLPSPAHYNADPPSLLHLLPSSPARAGLVASRVLLVHKIVIQPYSTRLNDSRFQFSSQHIKFIHCIVQGMCD